jgi:hypothetical protein
MFRFLVGLGVVLVVSALLWLANYKTYPLFVANEALAESAKLGVLTPELEVRIMMEQFKSSLLFFVGWGSIVGLAGGLASVASRWSFPRLLASILAGSLTGLATAYISRWYTMSSEPPVDAIQYWVFRWSIVLVLFPVIAGIAAASDQPSPQKVAEAIIKGFISVVVACVIFSFLMGLASPLEQAQFLFPQSPINNAILLFAVNGLLFVALAFRKSEKIAAIAVKQI